MQRVIQTCIEMITQRGYKIMEKTDDHIIGINKEEKKICVFLKPSSQINTPKLHAYIGTAKDMNVNNCIIIYTNNITPIAKNNINDMPNIGIRIEPFHLSELYINVTKHNLVPKHIKMGEKEKVKFLNKYGNNHPILLVTDIISRFYGFLKGDVIKIIRRGGYVSYRIVG